MIAVGSEYRGKYRVLREIATGGTSSVYLLRDLRLDRPVVLKKGVPGDHYKEEDLRAIFTNEDRILVRLNGRFAPTRFEFLPEALELYMAYCPGRTLDAYLQEWISTGTFPSDEHLVRLAESILEAVRSCHSAGVIIADLKPRNIQIGQGTTETSVSITLLDFGSSWIVGQSDAGRRPDYSLGYGAPELHSGEIPTQASDVYSFGAILFALFARREPSLTTSPRNFGERASSIHPPLRELILRTTQENPAARPPVEEVQRILRDCAQTLAELAQARFKCPQCDKPIPDQKARFCRFCGAKLTRETLVLSHTPPVFRPDVDPVRQMVKSRQAGEYMNALFWAKKAHELGALSAEHKVDALEIALQVSKQTFHEYEFAADLALSICPDGLSGEVKRRYLVGLGEILKARKLNFQPYRQLFEEGVKTWPNEESLWLWLALASPERKEEILRQGLEHRPESAKIRLHLGWVLNQKGARAEALAVWVEAIQLAEHETRFLIGVYQLARELNDHKRAEIVRQVILGKQPQDANEALLLSQFAAEEGHVAKALAYVDKGLLLDPCNDSLQHQKAKILFSEGKYELVLELDWMKAPNDVALRIMKGKCLYEVRRYAEAAHEMAAIISSGNGTEESWFYLVRCYQRLGQLSYARKALSEALRAFPNSEQLRRLAKVIEQG